MKLHIYKENDKYVYKKRGVLSSQTILLYNQLKVIRSHLCHIHLRIDLSRVLFQFHNSTIKITLKVVNMNTIRNSKWI